VDNAQRKWSIKSSASVASAFALVFSVSLSVDAQPVNLGRLSHLGVRTLSPIQVDGRANELVWSRAPASWLASTREPVYGGKPPLKTSFQVAYDDQNLYVLVRAEVGTRAVVRTLRRDDGSIGDDDGITLRIDPNDDRRCAYAFTVNAAGAQLDSLVLDEGAATVAQWDGVWEGKVAQDASGYTAELKIPFALLSTRPRERSRMSINLTRVSVAPSFVADWQLPDPPQKAAAPSTFGALDGLAGIRAQKLLELTPYVAARTDFKSRFSIDPTRSPTLRAGLGARLELAPASYAELSLLTDFSQEAIDSVQVAGDRFPLFFDERRQFFVSGLSHLRFGQERVRQLIDTRRIGLVGERSVPIVSGLKVYGQSGAISYALLNVQTLGQAADPRNLTPETKPENYSVGRLRFAPTRNLWLGGIVANKHRFSEANNDHFSLGLDGELRSDDAKWSWYTFWAGASTEHPATPERSDVNGLVTAPYKDAFVNRGEAAYTRLGYAGQLFRPTADVAYSTQHFDPALGYFSRTGVGEHYLSLPFVPQVNRFGIREISIGGSGSVGTSAGYDRVLKGSVALDVNFAFLAGHTLQLHADRRVDVVDNDFAFLGYQVLKDTYTNSTRSVVLTTPSRQSADGYFRYAYSNVFGGYRHELTQTLRLRPSRYFTLLATYEHWSGRLDEKQEHFSFGFGNGNVVFALTPSLSFDAIGRMSLQPTHEQFGVQGRMRYQYLPGSDLYLVYRSNQPLAGSDVSTFHELSLKLSYYAQLGI
jgi:hypothetical protein